MTKPISLFRARRKVTSDDGGTTIIKYKMTKPVPAPYEMTWTRDTTEGCYTPSLQSMCIKTLVRYPNEVHVLEGTKFAYKPPEEPGDHDLLREVIPTYGEEDSTSTTELLKFVDPRLWAIIIQLYSSLPESFRSYQLPLYDAHLPLLQEIPNTRHFSLITILELRSCQELDDNTIHELGQLHNLTALDLGATPITQWGVRIFSVSLVKNPQHDRILSGPWGLRILSLRDCMRITDSAVLWLRQFPLLSVIDLRGTQCSLNAHEYTHFIPGADDTLYHPTPLRDALSNLARRTSSSFFSHPEPFSIHINKLEHQTHKVPIISRHPKTAASLERLPRRRPSDVFGGADPMARARADIVTLTNQSRTRPSTDHMMNAVASVESQSHTRERAVAAFYSAFGRETGLPDLPSSNPDHASRNPRTASGSLPNPWAVAAACQLRLFRDPPPWSVLYEVQASAFEEAATRSRPTKRSRKASDDNPQSSQALVESNAARQSIRAVFGLLKKRMGSSKPPSSSGEPSHPKAGRVNPFSRQMVRSVFATSNAKMESEAPPADANPARKKRRVSLATDDVQEELEEPVTPVPKSTLVIPPRSDPTKPLKPIFSLPRPIFPEQEAEYKKKHEPQTPSRGPAPTKPSPSTVQSKLSSFAGNAVSASRPPGSGFHPDRRPDKPSKAATKIGAGGSGSGEPSGPQQQPVTAASKKKRKSTDSSKSFDWKSWGS